jgi:NTE family protein
MPSNSDYRGWNKFWTRVVHRPNWLGATNGMADNAFMYWSTLFGGIPAFFKPNIWAGLGPHLPLQPDAAGYYSAEPLLRTLSELVDFHLLNSSGPRVTVGAANVRTSEMRYFDSRASVISVKHVLASGALPPAFPAVRVDGELYWDGGILSNSPAEVVFEDNPRKDALIFSVNMWNLIGDEPRGAFTTEGHSIRESHCKPPPD